MVKVNYVCVQQVEKFSAAVMLEEAPKQLRSSQCPEVLADKESRTPKVKM